MDKSDRAFLYLFIFTCFVVVIVLALHYSPETRAVIIEIFEKIIDGPDK